MNEKLSSCISDFDKYCHSKRGAIYIANSINLELEEGHLIEIAHRRNNPDYAGLSDQEVVATSLNPELIKPFESSESAEITEIIKPSEIIENLAS